MLIEMNVTNFRSFKEKQTFSMVKGTGKELPNNAFTAQMSSGKSIDLLHSAAIYGANASGKSNFLYALYAMERIITQRKENLPVVPFRLHTEYKDKPTEFEVTVLIDGIRYQYGFSATEKQIYDEWLFVYSKGTAQRWFEREWNEEKQEYDWYLGAKLSGDKQVWKRATRNNALFLSTAINNNSQSLKPLFDWFKKTVQFIGTDDFGKGLFTINMCENNQEHKKDILKFLKFADFNICNIDIKNEEIKLPNDIPEGLKEFFIYQAKQVFFAHQDNNQQPVLFNLENDESDGTKKFFALAAPFLDILKNGKVVFIDELNNSLHPKLVQFLVELFHNKETNPKNAQLIFTTHDTTILNQDVFRRDQIWFCEKNQDNATTLYPLSDFHPRKKFENLEAAYLSGRYGALPFIQPFHLGE
ncbi:MAG: ATP-binding protein [Neisseriaceae bacterium]|nr:ATP-binding protein [Neisseriaceae bacterium]